MIVVVGLVLLLDRVEERLHVVVLAADEPDDELFLVAVVVLVLPGQHALDAVAIDGDVVVCSSVDGRDDGQLHLRVRRLVLQHVDQFAHSHGRGPSVVVVDGRRVGQSSPSQSSARSSRNRLTSRQRSSVSQNALSSAR